MKTTTCRQTALKFHEMGLPICFVPPGEKGPKDSGWQKKRFTREELERRFKRGPKQNVGLILGPDSLIDVEGDAPESEAGLKELFGGEIPVTPSWGSTRGVHRLFKYDPRLEVIGKAVVKYAKGTPKEVEFRLGCGEKGAQSLLPPSRTDRKTRKWIVPLDEKHPPARLPQHVIDKLLELSAPPKPKTYSGKAKLGTPGGDFNTSAEWPGLLEPHGWVCTGISDETTHWRRPGKATGISATTGFCKSPNGYDLFYNFSSNAPPFESGKAYSRFAVYALLEHGGDFKEAAKALRKAGYGETPKSNIASRLVTQLAETEAELFHTPGGEAYATVMVDDHRETLKVESKPFKSYLSYAYYKKTGNAPSSKALSEALNVITAQAEHDGPSIDVFTRVAAKDHCIYLDLANEKWEAVEISATGFGVVLDPPVKFRRPNGMLPLPYPVSGGSLDELRRFVNTDDRSWPLAVSVLVGSMGPGPKPILLARSSQGSCKTFSLRALRRVNDPNEADLRGSPDTVKDLALSAQNGLYVGLDNLSRVPHWLADALCRISTGAGLGSRALYTDDEEKLLNVQATVMVTAIEELTRREDFLDRCVLIELPRMSGRRRDYEEELWEEYEAAHPRILGALLTAASSALMRKGRVKLEHKPRMADFARWCTAAEPGLGWKRGEFMRCYSANRAELNQIALDTPLATAVIAFACAEKSAEKSARTRPRKSTQKDDKKWSGTASELLSALRKHASHEMQVDPSWPRGANTLSGALRRMRLDLKTVGVLVGFKRRLITILATERLRNSHSVAASTGPEVTARPGTSPSISPFQWTDWRWATREEDLPEILRLIETSSLN
jgi:hypothetical protein